jgi:hypothetical protein
MTVSLATTRPCLPQPIAGVDDLRASPRETVNQMDEC